MSRTEPHGVLVRYIERDGQRVAQPVEVRPAATVSTEPHVIRAASPAAAEADGGPSQ